MSDRISRRTWLRDVSAASAGSVPAGGAHSRAPAPQPDGTIVTRTSTSDVFVPPRGRSFMKFSVDFPEPPVTFEGYAFGFRVFTHEHTYSLSASHLAGL